MKKQDMTIGHQYHIKYSELPSVLLAIGGYRRTGHQESQGHPQGAVHAAPMYKGYMGASLNLILTLQNARFADTYHEYTEEKFLAGEPIPEGTRLITASSKDLVEPWGLYVAARDAQRQREAERKALLHNRETKVIPKVKAELERLGVTGTTTMYSGKVELTLEAFLALAKRIPTEVTK